MFTGIIKHIGKVNKITADSLHIISGASLVKLLKPGDSIAVNGACLTAARVEKKSGFFVDVMPETIKKTMLGKLRRGNKVNLELAMKIYDRLGGHILQGHIDGVGIIKSIKQADNSRIFTFIAPKNILQYLAEKGSVAINGISLTLISVSKIGFQVGIIPHTLRHTNLEYAKVGDKVNIEVDILARYIKNFFK